MVEAPWNSIGRDGNGLDQRRLAQRLSKYGVKSKNVRIMGSVVKGYERNQFEDVWKRYVVAEPDDVVGPPPREPATAATPLHAVGGTS